MEFEQVFDLQEVDPVFLFLHNPLIQLILKALLEGFLDNFFDIMCLLIL